ncbi:MAG: PmbA/TldA family metallopeptidase, partial [Nitrospinota bacterium]
MAAEPAGLGRDPALSALDALLKSPPAVRADRVEAYLVRRSGGYARCARSRIHQSAEESSLSVSLRAAVGGGVGTASTGRLAPDALRDALESALRAARAVSEVSETSGGERLGPLAEPGAGSGDAPDGRLDEETARFGAPSRAEALFRAFRVAAGSGQTVAGVFATWLEERAAANTAGLRAYAARTVAETHLIVEGERDGNYTPSGYAHGVCGRAADLDVDALTRKAVEKCARS